MTDEAYMAKAIEEAERAQATGEWPFGTVIVCGGQIVAANRVSERADHDVLSHSELKTLHDACVALGRNTLNDCVIYCTAEPCLMCSAAIFQAKIPRVVFAVSRDDLAHLLRQRQLRIDDLIEDSGYPIELVRGVGRERVLSLFQSIRPQYRHPH